MFCPNCGTQIVDGAVFCSNCGQPVPVSGAVSSDAVAGAGGAVAAAGGAVADAVSGRSSYSSQAPDYQQEFYSQNQRAPHEQPPRQQAAPRVFDQPATSRALAMCVYWGLLPLIFGFVVRDKDDPFITFHLNQALVCFIGFIIAAALSIILIGGILGIYLLVMVIMGTVNAYNGEMNELPLIGAIKIVK